MGGGGGHPLAELAEGQALRGFRGALRFDRRWLRGGHRTQLRDRVDNRLRVLRFLGDLQGRQFLEAVVAPHQNAMANDFELGIHSGGGVGRAESRGVLGHDALVVRRFIAGAGADVLRKIALIAREEDALHVDRRGLHFGRRWDPGHGRIVGRHCQAFSGDLQGHVQGVFDLKSAVSLFDRKEKKRRSEERITARRAASCQASSSASAAPITASAASRMRTSLAEGDGWSGREVVEDSTEGLSKGRTSELTALSAIRACGDGREVDGE